MEKLAQQVIKQSKRIQWAWSKDWVLKLVSLFFALFLWYFVSGEDRVDMTVPIPVEIVNLPRNLVISNTFKGQLDVTVSGPRGLIRSIGRLNISRSIDLSKAAPGNVVVRNELDSIAFPRGIQVLRIQPTHIILLLDQLIQKEIPIKPIIGEAPPETFRLKGITLEPDRINLSGPDAVIGKLFSLKTMPIDLSDIQGSTTRQVSLNLTPKIAELIGEPTVTAKIEVQERLADATAKGVPVQAMGLTDHLAAKITPSAVTVELQVPPPMLGNGKNLAEAVQATVAAEAIGPGVHDLPVGVAPTVRGIRIVSVTPDKVTVTVTEPPPDKTR